MISLKRYGAAFLALAVLILLSSRAHAELTKLEIQRREPFAPGIKFGDIGAYEIIAGVGHFAVDPKHERNRQVVDLELAPRNDRGLVECSADFFILAPKDTSKRNGAILYDVNNRGNKLAIRFFNGTAGGNDPHEAPDAGDGFLMRRGYTIVWSGWIGELLPGDGRMLLKPPVATEENDQPIRGIVRYEMVTDTPAETMPLARREGHGSYRPTARGLAEAALTWRMRETDERIPIPREQWSLEEIPLADVERGVSGTLPQIRMRLAGGFRPGYLYELICEAEGPIVQGLGYTTVRDLLSFLRYDKSDRNPLHAAKAEPIDRVHGFGVSQSGRFLRNYLYLGFNADEQGRKVFDGLMPHVAGAGLGFFNHRFAQATRHNNQHFEHLFPGDYFPFNYGDSVDPHTGRTDGILRRTQADDPRLLPKVMHTQGSAEYWSRSGSLVHTDPLGKRDVEIPDNVRIYSFGGTQHSATTYPLQPGVGDNLLNPADYSPFLKALLDALDAWVRNGATPPESVYPRIDRGSLVNFTQESTRFPAIPGVRYPEFIHTPHALDYGPEFLSRGIISIEPPRRLGDYSPLVPKCGPDGNELGTLLVPEVAVPLATYTGWNLRRRDMGAEAMLVGLMGSYLPFPRTRSERQASGDLRPSIEERYGSFANYKQQFAAACKALVEERYMLQEDANRLIKSRDEVREQFAAMNEPAKPESR